MTKIIIVITCYGIFLDVLDMVDVIMEGSEGEIEQLGPTLTDDLIIQSFPFSAVVPAVLEARNGLPAAHKEEKGIHIFSRVMHGRKKKTFTSNVCNLSVRGVFPKTIVA